MPGVLVRAVLLVVSPYRHFPDQNQCGWTHPCNYYDCKNDLRNNYHGTLRGKKQGLLFTDHGGSMPVPGHTVRSRVERERMCKPKVLHLLGQMLGLPWVFTGSLFIGSLKQAVI